MEDMNGMNHGELKLIFFFIFFFVQFEQKWD